mmetsp:Transcript_4948/g.11875  ORF Transcript_4948/g.11875 Transcript_4948/m.11875 type:complete len:300 (+) Transcript_4948:25-924(+)
MSIPKGPEYAEVRSTFRAVRDAKPRVDVAAPSGLDLPNFHIINRTFRERQKMTEHEQRLRHLQRRIASYSKPVERKKVAHAVDLNPTLIDHRLPFNSGRNEQRAAPSQRREYPTKKEQYRTGVKERPVSTKPAPDRSSSVKAIAASAVRPYMSPSVSVRPNSAPPGRSSPVTAPKHAKDGVKPGWNGRQDDCVTRAAVRCKEDRNSRRPVSAQQPRSRAPPPPRMEEVPDDPDFVELRRVLVDEILENQVYRPEELAILFEAALQEYSHLSRPAVKAVLRNLCRNLGVTPPEVIRERRY